MTDPVNALARSEDDTIEPHERLLKSWNPARRA